MVNLEDKVAIITGASSGIGRATAVLFSNLGSKLVLTGRNEEALNETIELCNQNMDKKGCILKVIGDLTNKDLSVQIVEESIKKFKKIDVLVNNAGFLKTGSIETIKLEDFDELMNLNVKSVIRLTQLCLPYLIEQKGSIVNVSSVAGLYLNNF
jgi:NADP-dependent 3-hydroxy acid dehydrogenase YdfG